MRKRVSAFLMLLVLFSISIVHAQMKDPVHFKSELKVISDVEAEIIFTGTIDNGRYILFNTPL